MIHPMARSPENEGRAYQRCAVSAAFCAAVLASLSWLLPSASRAAPSDLCPGYCEKTSIPCGAASDCDGAACVFQPECLPGQSHALPFVESIIPEWSGGLNDYTNGWSCGLLECLPGPGFLAFASRFGSSAVATKDIALPPGRYLAVAEMAADPGAWGFFDIASNEIEASAEPTLAREWTLASVAFELPEGHSNALQFRLHADGDGYVRVRRIFILTLRDQGVYVRFRPKSGEPLLRLTRVFDQVEAPPGRAITLCDDGHLDGCVSPELGEVRARAGEATPWIALGSLAAGPGRMTVSWDVFDCASETCPPNADPLELSVDLAFAPDDSAIVGTLERQVRHRFGLVLPRADAHPFDFRIESLSDLIGRDFESIIGVPTSRIPKRLKVGLATGVFDAFDDTVVGFDLYALLDRLGINIQSFCSARPSADERSRASNAGLKYRWLDLSEPATHLRQVPFDLEPETITAEIGTLLEDPTSSVFGQIAAANDDFGAELPSRAFGILGESAGFPLAGPAYRAAYLAWLEARGETALSLGLETLDAVQPLEAATPEVVLAFRPNPVDVFAARRWYLALEFWNEASAQVMAIIESELIARLGSVPMALRNGDPFGTSTHTLLSGLSIDRIQRALQPEAFLATLDTLRPGDCHPWDFSAWADYVAGLTEPVKEGLDSQGKALSLGVELRTERVELGAVLIELASRGFTWFNHLSYGPRAVHDASARGGEADSRAFFDVLRSSHELLSRAENYLVDSHQETADVVIMIPDADPVWTDEAGPSADEIGWHTALSQNSIPVEFIRESEIAYGLLGSPLKTRRALILLRKHVSTEAWGEIERWVEDGGTLILGPELASHDEYGQFVPTRLVWSGLSAGDWRVDIETVRWAGAEGISSFVYTGRWRNLSAVSGTTLGASEDDVPVALRIPLRRGRVLALGVALGEGFGQPSSICNVERPESLVRYPDGYSPVVRDTVRMLAGQARVTPSFEVNPPMLSMRAMTTADGNPFVLAVHWGTARAPSLISIPQIASCRVVRDAMGQAELPLSYGRLFAETDIASIFTWENEDCVTETSDEVEGAEVEQAPVGEDGCAGASGVPMALFGLGLILARAVSSSPRGPTHPRPSRETPLA